MRPARVRSCRREADARPEDDFLRVQPGRDEQARHLRNEPELQVGVGREALRSAEEVVIADVREGRDAHPRRFEHRPEVLPVRPELDEPIRRHARRRPRLAVRFECADDEATAVMADVEKPSRSRRNGSSGVAAGVSSVITQTCSAG